MQGSVLSLLAAVLLLGSATAQDLKINVTLPVKCDKKTKTGDLIHVNYNGTLTDGTLFDSSYSGKTSDPISFGPRRR